MTPQSLPSRLEGWIFSARPVLIALFVVVTMLMAWSASRLQVDAGFSKLLPLDHPYMQTFIKYRQEFGGANRVLVAVMARDGDIFTPAYFDTLKKVTDEVFFLPGVDRARVRSLFTPNVRFTEVVEDGIAGGNVIPADFEPSEAGLAQVRRNILKAGILGRLVANDFSGAIISAELLEFDPNSGKKLNYISVAEEMEKRIRDKYQNDSVGIELDIHIIGFAKVIGDISAGATRVLSFFAIAFVIAALLVLLYTRSLALTLIALSCSLVAVIWQLGLLPLLGYGLDPMSILVPFLVFAIGVSHGVQMVNATGGELLDGYSPLEAAERSFRRLLIPGTIALLSDTIGFLTILLIDIPMIQELAITASLGVAVIILTNLLILQLALSYCSRGAEYARRVMDAAQWKQPIWHALSYLATRRVALVVLAVAAGVFALGWQGSQKLSIGDLQAGVPELRPDSRYNRDTDQIISRFSIGVDLLQVITEGPDNGCIDYPVIEALDRFDWAVRNIPGVQSTISLAGVMKIINAGWNEGHPAWQVLSRNSQVLVRAVRPVETSTGLLNEECSVMPLLVFTDDHRAETIDRIIAGIRAYQQTHPDDPLTYRLATGNVGIMAATNDTVREAQLPILIWVYAAIIALCLLMFRSLTAMLCTVLPLTLVSVLCYALMAQLGIGLKISTLPVAALGVGIGVDYGIYIFDRLRHFLGQGMALRPAYEQTLRETGSAVIFTGMTLSLGVGTWIFSDLQFQADMGLLLAFMFLVNMLGAIFVLPALAALFYRQPATGSATPTETA